MIEAAPRYGNAGTTFDSAAFKCVKQNLYLKLCKDILFHQVMLMVFVIHHINSTLIVVIQLQFPRFAKYD